MKRIIVLAIAIMCVSVSMSSAETEDKYKDFKVDVVKTDGGLWGKFWRLFYSDYDVRHTEINPQEKTMKVVCTGGGTQSCPEGKIGAPVPVGVPHDIWDTLENEAGMNIFNDILTGEFSKMFYNTETGKKIIFNTSWQAKDLRNNTVVIKYIVLD